MIEPHMAILPYKYCVRKIHKDIGLVIDLVVFFPTPDLDNTTIRPHRKKKGITSLDDALWATKHPPRHISVSAKHSKSTSKLWLYDRQGVHLIPGLFIDSFKCRHECLLSHSIQRATIVKCNLFYLLLSRIFLAWALGGPKQTQKLECSGFVLNYFWIKLDPSSFLVKNSQCWITCIWQGCVSHFLLTIF